MATTIVLKNSVTTTNTPSSLAQGEVAINVTDKKVWVGNAATTPVQIVNGGPDGVFTSVTDSGLTNTRVTYAGAGGLLKDSANIVTDGSKITTSTGFVGGPWTTATRPSSPATGQEGFNTTLGVIEAYDGTAWYSTTTIAPTTAVYTSGSGTYTTPTGAKYLYVKMVGAGGGGAGGGATTSTAGGTGGSTTFGSTLLVCVGGGGGSLAANGTPSTGGGTGVYSPALGIGIAGGQGSGGNGQSSVIAGFNVSSAGGNSAFGGGGGGAENANGGNGNANTGGGGAGGGAGQSISAVGGGGAAGGYIDAIIPSPSATYSYAIGAGGTGGNAGTSAYAGGAGGSGIIYVLAYF
jgi:hypothetical protein